MSAKKLVEAVASSSESMAKKKKKQGDSARETIESIAIAFVLAFLFKTFQAEAYVIPTGSMAPTLYGRHKEVTCSCCGFQFALGASSELDQDSGQLMGRIETAFCSNCGKANDVADAPVFNGDRILVNKQVSDFQRFDVVVFKNPEQGHVNYIKRLVGLPKETLRIRRGDLWVKKEGESNFQIQRKSPSVQKDIQLTVYDDRFPATELLDLGWPERWEPAVQSNDAGATGGWLASQNAWTADRETRKYSCEASDDGVHWLRYRHFQPPNWQDAGSDFDARARLIADFCSFNAYYPQFPGSTYWVGDLTLNAAVEVTRAEANSELVLELVEGPLIFRCVIDLRTGVAELQSGNTADSTNLTKIASGETALSGTGLWDLTFANVDDRLCLWVDGDLVEFDASTEYQDSVLPQPTQKDLAPVGIAVRNAAVTVTELLLERDIYYRNDIIAFDQQDGVSRLPSDGNGIQQDEVPRAYQLQDQLHNPEAWARVYAEESASQLEAYGRYGDYVLADDEFLMFGDNSSMSKDSRLFDYQARPMNGVFSHRYAVRRQDLIGKALFIFWPHGVPFLNGGEGIPVRYHKGPRHLSPEEYPSVRVPFYPNVNRMKKIR